jgi:hypothetical protein
VSIRQETVRYWGETEAEREAAFEADSVNRAARGWLVSRRLTEWPFGKSGLDLVVTYQFATDTEQPPSAPQLFSVPAVGQPTGRPGQAFQPYAWAPSTSASIIPGLEWIMGSGNTEPALARCLRRLLVFGALPAAFTIGMLTESPFSDAGTQPGMYPGLAVAVGLEGVVTLGVAWYLLRWRLIPLPVRLVGVAILVLFCADLLVAAFGYAIGQP